MSKILKAIIEFIKKKLAEILKRWALRAVAILFVFFVVGCLLIWLMLGGD